MTCFTAEEVWSHLPAPHLREKSVHMAKFVPPGELRSAIPDKQLKRLENWARLVAVRNEVLKALEVARQEKFIGASLEAKVCLVAAGELEPLLEQYRAALPALFIVSQVALGGDSGSAMRETEIPGLRIRIEKATGRKCDRCWNYSERVGQDAHYPTVCERCSAALKEIEAADNRP